MIKLLGIKNCDKVRSARKWFQENNIDYQFQDIRDIEVPEVNWNKWLDVLGWEVLINRRSTSWKQLDPAQRDSLDNHSAGILLNKNPTLMKRPLLIIDEVPKVTGFDPQRYLQLIESK